MWIAKIGRVSLFTKSTTWHLTSKAGNLPMMISGTSHASSAEKTSRALEEERGIELR
jgi:hypothetical protein